MPPVPTIVDQNLEAAEEAGPRPDDRFGRLPTSTSPVSAGGAHAERVTRRRRPRAIAVEIGDGDVRADARQPTARWRARIRTTPDDPSAGLAPCSPNRLASHGVSP